MSLSIRTLGVTALAACTALLGLPLAEAAPRPTTPATPKAPATHTPPARSSAREASARTSAREASARTSAREARRVDRINLRLAWYRCGDGLECAVAKLPLDYDHPKGAQTSVAMVRRRATDPHKRLGTLFVNPGGPSGSATAMVAEGTSWLSPAVTSRFDVVGIDPRGVGASSQVRCFPTHRAKTLADAGLGRGLPQGAAQEKAYLAASAAVADACSTTGRPLTGAASTAEVARDMDVVRRAVGDRRLTYLGFSYGTYLGQVYANLFPDRVRSLVLDGVVDPLAWAGTSRTRTTPVTLRLGSAEGSQKALDEAMRRCDLAGPTRCAIAGKGDTRARARLDAMARRVARKPIDISVPAIGFKLHVDYPTFVGMMTSLLYRPDAGDQVTLFVAGLEQLAKLPSPPAAKQQAARQLARQMELVRPTPRPRVLQDAFGHGLDFTYDNEDEAFDTVTCTDTLNPSRQRAWSDAVHAARTRIPYFAEVWGWESAPCATSHWRVRDEDAYRGPFTRRTVAPVLVVGDTYDPATNYRGAVAASRLLPNSRLLSSDSWGHTAYGTSSCVTGAVDRYLLNGALPAAGTTCKGPQPFATSLDDVAMNSASVSTRGAHRTIPGLPTGPVLPRR